jgi:hypothetical protein
MSKEEIKKDIKKFKSIEVISKMEGGELLQKNLRKQFINLIDVIQVIISNPSFNSLGVLIIAKAVGIFFFPLGAILGYF